MRWEYNCVYFPHAALDPDEFAEMIANWINRGAARELVTATPRERGENIYIRRRVS